MFESYDFFSSKGGNQVPYTSLMQALEKINVHYSKEDFLNTYPQFKLDRTVTKNHNSSKIVLTNNWNLLTSWRAQREKK